MKNELENLIASFYKWTLRKNMLATKDNNFPIIITYDAAYVSHIDFDLAQSSEKSSIKIKKLQICYEVKYINPKNIIEYKSQIKEFIKCYLKAYKNVTTYKFSNINKACTDIIDNENVYLNKETKVTIKSILSKAEVVDYKGNIYKLSDLYIRYL